jgi:hypothetical protein
MTPLTGGGAPPTIGVAILAVDLHMDLIQGEAGYIVIETLHLPALVAGLAIGAQPGRL